jgi:hypothetical protein
MSRRRPKARSLAFQPRQLHCCQRAAQHSRRTLEPQDPACKICKHRGGKFFKPGCSKLFSTSTMSVVGTSTIASPLQVADTVTIPLPTDRSKSRHYRARRTCQHGKFKPYCKECKGSMLCAHLRHKNRCAACKRSSVAIGDMGASTACQQAGCYTVTILHGANEGGGTARPCSQALARSPEASASPQASEPAAFRYQQDCNASGTAGQKRVVDANWG